MSGRRAFLRGAALVGAASLLLPWPPAHAATGANPKRSANRGACLRWLEGAPALSAGCTVGVPWPRGMFKRGQEFVLKGGDGAEIAGQSWPTAYWPDGSLKWTAHALPAGAGLVQELVVQPGSPRARAATTLSLTERAGEFVIGTGSIGVTVPKRGRILIAEISRDGQPTLRGGHLVALLGDTPDANGATGRPRQYDSDIERVTLEQSGPLRAVLKIDGRHMAQDRAWLPFTVRLYFHAGAESVRMMHTFVFDGDEHKDFIRGIGVRFEVPLRDALHDRHVRFAGEEGGLWGEGIRTLTGLRRSPGAEAQAAQIDGRAAPPPERFERGVGQLLKHVPAWGDFTLSQLHADGFQIRKRTRDGHGWIHAASGRRALGTGYIGGASGGVAFGLRDFWQRHPVQLDIRNAHTEAATVTLWMYAPDGAPMDMRFYHDGMGLDTVAEQNQALDITYEDYDPGWGTPKGIARSSEISLWALPATPAREQLVRIAEHVRTPPQLVPDPAHMLAAGVFGGLWSLPDRSTPARRAIEDQLDAYFDFYRKEVEQRRWYGFWDYGDIRHSYDPQRHEWRYDVGGYAWDNSELSPDLWLWYAFLRSGRADIFRFAEALNRHGSDVDTYHLGRFAGLGTRHGVQHWSDGVKQLRISTAVYRRFYYYLTADERTGDVLRELLGADERLAEVDGWRKVPGRPLPSPYPARVNFGTDWGSLAGAWLTEWERSGDRRYRDKLLTGMRDMASMPQGFFTGDASYDAATGRMAPMNSNRVAASHLQAVFGAQEVFAEIIALLDDPAFTAMWLRYCELFNSEPAEQRAALGAEHRGGRALYVAHSRLTAYAAYKRRDAVLARRAWKEFLSPDGHSVSFNLRRVLPPAVLAPVDEIQSINTNGASQWCLAAIQNLALIGEYLD